MRAAAGRQAEADSTVERFTRWAARRPDVMGLLLVGSYARGDARPDSDVDLVLLTTGPAQYLDRTVWATRAGLSRLIRKREWGPITELRFVTESGLEVEIGIGPTSWACTDPLDPGTRRVVRDGARVLLDPTGALARLLRACRA